MQIMIFPNVCVLFFLGLVVFNNRGATGIVEPAQCSCCMLGTIETKQGVSACDEEGNCQCLPNVEGKNCDRCVKGFYGILNGKCKPCRCSTIGSKGPECDVSTGQCLCKDGFTGFRCEMCDFPEDFPYDTFPPPCDGYRSIDPFYQDKNGTCQCKPHAIGATCNLCEANYYFNYTTSQCTKYSACVLYLKEKLADAQEHLHEMSKLITEQSRDSDKDTNEWLLNVKTLYNKILALLNAMLQKPHVQQIVKLQYLQTILDLIETGIRDIRFYLNGFIKFDYLENRIKELKLLYKKITKITLPTNSNDTNDDNLQIIVDINRKVDSLFGEIDILEKKQESLKENIEENHNNVTNRLKIKTMKTLQLEMDIFISKVGKIQRANELLKEAIRERNASQIINEEAKLYNNEANDLELPEKIEHQVNEIAFPSLNDITERIEDAKDKFDIVNDILKFLDDLDTTDSMNEINNIIVKTAGLFSFVDTKQKELENWINEQSENKKNLQSEYDKLNRNIQQLRNDINIKQKKIEDLTDNIDTLGDLEELRIKMHALKDLLITQKTILESVNEAKIEEEKLQVYLKNFPYIIGFLKELIEYMNLIPVDEFDEINELLNNYEAYFKNINYLQEEKSRLEMEVNNTGVLLDSLQIKNPQLCPSTGPSA